MIHPFKVVVLGDLEGPGVARGVLEARGGPEALVVLPRLCFSFEQDTVPDNPDTNIHLSDAIAGPS
jgi:hypothetical protein